MKINEDEHHDEAIIIGVWFVLIIVMINIFGGECANFDFNFSSSSVDQ